MGKLNRILMTVGALALGACGGAFEAASVGDGVASRFVAYEPAALAAASASATAAAATPDQLMARLKYKGCMFNDLLTDATGVTGGTFNAAVEMLKRSNCESLPRAVETWSKPPDWARINQRIAAVRAATGRDFDYGMFIAESISTVAVYADDQGKKFDFAAMCKPGSKDFWGANTCVPHFGNAEFVRYVKYVVGKAADAGIRNVMIGQTGHTDPQMKLKTLVPELRAIVAARGRQMLIGQQPNGNQPSDYLKVFDFVSGPSYVGQDVSQACLPGTDCQAVLFHPSVVKNANNVIAELDWSSVDDDIHRYAKLSPAQREALVAKLAAGFFKAGVGFFFPFSIVLNGGSPNGNCYGPNQYLYMAHQDYGCKDESFLNRMLAGDLAAGGASSSSSVTPATPATPTVPAMSDAQARQIVLDRYVSILGRTAAEAAADGAGIAYWVAKLTSGYPVAKFEADLRASDELYVRNLYQTILKRKADAAGLEFYLARLAAGLLTRAQVKAALQNACDNHVNGECPVAVTTTTPQIDDKTLVISAYINVLGRSAAETSADTAGIAYWVGRMKAGTTISQVINEMKASDEYFVRIQMYKGILKRTGEAAGVAYWTDQLARKLKTRAQVQADFKYVCDNHVGGECK